MIGTVSPKTACEIAKRHRSVIDYWADNLHIGKRDPETGKMRIDVIGLHLKTHDRLIELREYASGKMTAEKIEELRAESGIGDAFTNTIGATAVDLLIVTTNIKIPVMLRAALLNDAEALGVTPIEVLLSFYEAGLTKRAG